MKIEGSRCLVVGGARGLGRQLALSLAADGAPVAVSSRSMAAAEAVRDELLERGARAAAVAGEVSTSSDARHLVAQAAAALGGVDAVVFAASGPFQPRPPQDVSEQEWAASMDVIARGFLFVAQAARARFLQQAQLAADDVSVAPARRPDEPQSLPAERGVVVAITDIGAVQPWGAFAAHCAAKAAQLMLVRALAKAWATDGVRVCGVAPGPVDLRDDPRREASERAAARLTHGRLVRPEEVASAVRFCIATPSMTGGHVTVDGGALLR